MLDFFLCNNPTARKPEGMVDYIYHNGKPRFFSGVIELDLFQELKPLDYGLPNKIFIYKRGDGYIRFFLLLVDQHMGRVSSPLLAALKNAAAYYTTVLNMTDENRYGKESSLQFLMDYNLLTPGLQVLHLSKINQYLVSYNGGVRSFDNPQAMDQFLNRELKYNDFQLETGNHNVFN